MYIRGGQNGRNIRTLAEKSDMSCQIEPRAKLSQSLKAAVNVATNDEQGPSRRESCPDPVQYSQEVVVPFVGEEITDCAKHQLVLAHGELLACCLAIDRRLRLSR